MAKLTFKLRPTSGTKAKIQLFFNYGTEKRLRYSTGYEVNDVGNWNNETSRISNVKSEVHRVYVNNKLNQLTAELENQYYELLRQNKNVGNEELKLICDGVCNKKTSKLNVVETPKMEFLEYFEWYIKNYQIKPLPTTRKPMVRDTAKSYQNALNWLKSFNDNISKLSFASINMNFYHDFIDYLNEENLSANYVGTIIKNLKAVMNVSFDSDLHTNLDFKKKSFARPSEDVFNVYLSIEELKRFEQVDIKKIGGFITNSGAKITVDKMEIARDLFLIGANTGLRVSNFNKLLPENITHRRGKSYFEVIAKGNKAVAVPINGTVRRILHKYKGTPPPSIPEQHINYAIKKVGLLAEINDRITFEVIRGGVKKTVAAVKHSKICTHTARRSFCTNAYLAGMKLQDIMAVSGHATEEMLKKYLKLTNIEKVEVAAQHEFFDDVSLKAV